MKVEVVARRARLHYSERKEWTRRERGGGGRQRSEEGGWELRERFARSSGEKKEKKNGWKRDEERSTLNVDVVVDNAGDYRRIHISRVI